MEVDAALAEGRINGKPVTEQKEYFSPDEERLARALLNEGDVSKARAKLGITWEQYQEVACRKSFQERYWELVLITKVLPRMPEAISKAMAQAAEGGKLSHLRLILELLGRTKTGDTYNVVSMDPMQMVLKLNQLKSNLRRLVGDKADE